MKKIKLILALAFTFFSGLKGLNVIVLPYSLVPINNNKDLEIHLLLERTILCCDLKGTVHYYWKDLGYEVPAREIFQRANALSHLNKKRIEPEEIIRSSAVNLLKKKTMEIFDKSLCTQIVLLYRLDTVLVLIKVPHIVINRKRLQKAHKDLLEKKKSGINPVYMQKSDFEWVPVEQFNQLKGLDIKLLKIFTLPQVKNVIDQIFFEEWIRLLDAKK